jgi:hypothetical protein
MVSPPNPPCRSDAACLLSPAFHLHPRKALTWTPHQANFACAHTPQVSSRTPLHSPSRIPKNPTKKRKKRRGLPVPRMSRLGPFFTLATLSRLWPFHRGKHRQTALCGLQSFLLPFAHRLTCAFNLRRQFLRRQPCRLFRCHSHKTPKPFIEPLGETAACCPFCRE